MSGLGDYEVPQFFWFLGGFVISEV